MNEINPLNKGPLAEESIRNFFIESNAFAVRSLKLMHKNEEVTDVDVWLYGKNNSFSRYRQIIDIKNKKSPGALERILWAKGLQSILKVESAVVATTDSKPSVRSFAEDHGITLMDGTALQTLIKTYENRSNRHTEEYLEDLFRSKINSLKQLGELYITSKTHLLLCLDFDGCNIWLENSRNLMTDSLIDDITGSYSLRILYSQIAFFLIGLDFCLASKAFDTEEQRKSYLQDGFFFGELGKKGVDKLIDSGILISKLTHPSSPISKSKVKDAIHSAAKAQNFDLLIEHFSKHEVRQRLFNLAREFEHLVFQKDLKTPAETSIEQKSLLLLLADVFGVKRDTIMNFTLSKEPQQLELK